MNGFKLVLSDALMESRNGQHYTMELLEVRAVRYIILNVAYRFQYGMQEQVSFFRVVETHWLVELQQFQKFVPDVGVAAVCHKVGEKLQDLSFYAYLGVLFPRLYLQLLYQLSADSYALRMLPDRN